MILKSAVEDFLQAPRDDHYWMKRLSHRELDDAIHRLRPRPWIPECFDKHQKVGFLLGVAYPRFCFWFDMGCVDCETEYLSPSGWRRMDDYDGGRVAQCWPNDRSIEFVDPTAYVVKPCSEMITFRTRFGIDQKLSSEHKVLYATAKEEPQVVTAEDVEVRNRLFSSGWAGRFWTTFTITGRPGVNLTDSELRVMVAFVADGSFYSTKGLGCIRLTKKRKQDRMRHLLRGAGLLYEARREKVAPGMINFVFELPRRCKTFDEFYWNANGRQLGIVADELFHWDGYTNKNKTFPDMFYSTVKENADFAQFALAASGRTTSLKFQDRAGEKRLFILNSRKDNKPIGMRKTSKHNPVVREKTFDGKKYCFEVPSGFLIFRRNGCIFLSGNTGKTLLALTLFRYRYDYGRTRKGLVFVPSDESLAGWEEQIEDWKINVPFVSLDKSSSVAKWAKLSEFDEGLILGTYPGLRSMVSKGEFVKNKTNDAERYHLKKTPAKVLQLCRDVRQVYFDESTQIAGRDSLQHSVARTVCKEVPSRFALAGQPFGRDPEMLFNQHLLIDDGATFGPTLGMFREAFYTKKKNFWGGPYSFKYTFRDEMDPDVRRIGRHRSISYDESECGDLPPRKYILKRVHFPSGTEAYYKEQQRLLRSARGNYNEMKNAFTKMRQISSGFLGVRDDETGDKVQIEFPHNPKLKRTLELIDEIPDGRKSIIFYDFTWSGRKLFHELQKMGREPVWLWSGTPDSRKALDRFKHDNSCQDIVIQNRLGNYSLNLQRANYEFFYESPVAVIDRRQAEKRAHRKGQTERVFIYDVVTAGTEDENILTYHAEGLDRFEAIFRGED